MLRQLGPWLKTHDRLFPQKPVADIAVLYDLPSAYENMWTEPGHSDRFTYGRVKKVDLTGVTELGRQGSFANDGDFSVFFELVQQLSEKHILYNVVYESPDEILTFDQIKDYKLVVVPDAFLMESHTAEILNQFQIQGGRLITIGRYIDALAPDRQYEAAQQEDLTAYLKPLSQIVKTDGSSQYGFALHALENGHALHLVNYNYNEQTHKIDSIESIQLKFNIPFSQIRCYSFPENDALSVETNPETGDIQLNHAGIYTILELMD